ncbi:hypothetical protein [Geomonas propionica]|uniref:Uncharacterized protein n=1 Tax=Geomonas propionica TaxID=2798582 RepID=A0ABS0YQF4_9BACT|nr:hypothetical protein [Geomonas propionica]MBJ6800179.1 hypothetical protein [Geomonas propionica]
MTSAPSYRIDIAGKLRQVAPEFFTANGKTNDTAFSFGVPCCKSSPLTFSVGGVPGKLNEVVFKKNMVTFKLNMVTFKLNMVTFNLSRVVFNKNKVVFKINKEPH